MFRAKPIQDILMNEDYSYEEFREFVKANCDDEGYIHGYYVDGYIVGPVVDVDQEYISLEWWCLVQQSTVEYLPGEK